MLVNREVAKAIASRYRNRGVPDDDLEQVAYEGLIKAVNRFDPGRAEDFLTFAVPTIRGELRRYFRDHGWTVRPTRWVQELQGRISQISADLSQGLGREPSAAELVQALGVEPEEYAEAVQAFGCFTPTSLDEPLRHDSTMTRGDAIRGDDDVALDPWVQLEPVVRQLPERDRRMLYLRFFEDKTQTEIGADIGVTQMQVSRLLTSILARLRNELTESPA